MDITLEDIFNVATSVVATASVIAAITPTPVDNAALIVARKVLDLVAFNFAGAKNQAEVNAKDNRFKR